jgi:GTPase
MDLQFEIGSSRSYDQSFLSESLSSSPEKDTIPQEVETGNVEYKRNLTSARIEKRTSQLKWRLAEGAGEALYELGVGDDGRLIGMTENEAEKSLSTMREMAKSLSATISVVREREVIGGRKVIEVMVRKSLSVKGKLVLR